MDTEDHFELLKALKKVEGMVVLSGYDHPLYNHELRSWKKFTTNARISSARGTAIRQECLWINPSCEKALKKSSELLFLQNETSDVGNKDQDMSVPSSQKITVGEARSLAGLRLADCIEDTAQEIRKMWHAHMNGDESDHPRDSHNSSYLAQFASYEEVGTVSPEKYCVGDPLMYCGPEGHAVKMWWGYPIHINTKKRYRVLAFDKSDLGIGIALDPADEIGITIFPAANDHGVFSEKSYPHCPFFLTKEAKKGKDHGRVQVIQTGPTTWTWRIEMVVNNESWATPATIHTSATSSIAAIEQAMTPLILRLARLAGNPGKPDSVRRSAKYLMGTLLSEVQKPSQTTIINAVRELLGGNG
jgi:hypothetical protein